MNMLLDNNPDLTYAYKLFHQGISGINRHLRGNVFLPLDLNLRIKQTALIYKQVYQLIAPTLCTNLWMSGLGTQQLRKTVIGEIIHILSLVSRESDLRNFLDGIDHVGIEIIQL